MQNYCEWSFRGPPIDAGSYYKLPLQAGSCVGAAPKPGDEFNVRLVRQSRAGDGGAASPQVMPVIMATVDGSYAIGVYGLGAKPSTGLVATGSVGWRSLKPLDVEVVLPVNEAVIPYFRSGVTPAGEYVIANSSFLCLGTLDDVKHCMNRIHDVYPHPTVSIAFPKEGARVSGTIKVDATDAADPNYGITSVLFACNGTTIWEKTRPPYSITWNTKKFPNGPCALTATARNPGIMTTTATVHVVVSN